MLFYTADEWKSWLLELELLVLKPPSSQITMQDSPWEGCSTCYWTPPHLFRSHSALLSSSHTELLSVPHSLDHWIITRLCIFFSRCLECSFLNFLLGNASSSWKSSLVVSSFVKIFMKPWVSDSDLGASVASILTQVFHGRKSTSMSPLIRLWGPLGQDHTSFITVGPVPSTGAWHAVNSQHRVVCGLEGSEPRTCPGLKSEGSTVNWIHVLFAVLYPITAPTAVPHILYLTGLCHSSVARWLNTLF